MDITKKINKTSCITFKIISVVAIVLLILCCYSKSAYADSISGDVHNFDVQVDAYEEPDLNSVVVHTFAAGDPVFITSEEDDWYVGYYKSQYIYIYKYATVTDAAGDATTLLSASESVDKDALSNEFKNAETQEKQALEDYEHEQTQKRNKYIWIAVIVTLVAALVIITVLKALKNIPDDN